MLARLRHKNSLDSPLEPDDDPGKAPAVSAHPLGQDDRLATSKRPAGAPKTLPPLTMLAFSDRERLNARERTMGAIFLTMRAVSESCRATAAGSGLGWWPQLTVITCDEIEAGPVMTPGRLCPCPQRQGRRESSLSIALRIRARRPPGPSPFACAADPSQRENAEDDGQHRSDHGEAEQAQAKRDHRRAAGAADRCAQAALGCFPSSTHSGQPGGGRRPGRLGSPAGRRHVPVGLRRPVWRRVEAHAQDDQLLPACGL
jgi:hypothetical protein